METQRDPYRILADLVFDLCPREEIRNFKRSVFGQELTIKDEFIHHFKVCGYRPIERYLNREVLEEDPLRLNLFYEEFTPERPKFRNLKSLFEVERGKCIRPGPVKTPREAADIIFEVVPKEIMEGTVREVRGMTFSIRDEFTLHFNELEYLVSYYVTPELIRKAALIIFSRGNFDFDEPDFSPFISIFEYEDCLTIIGREDVAKCTRSLREPGINTIRDVAKIALSVFTDEELKRHEETIDGRSVTLEDKFVKYFTESKFKEPRLNEYLTRDYIVKTVLIKIHRGEFDVENPDFSAFFDPFFRPMN